MNVDLNAHRLHVQRDGKTVKTMPVTGGSPQYQTWSGVMTVMSKDGTVEMTSQSVGLGDAYDKIVHSALRLTASGTFMHQAE